MIFGTPVRKARKARPLFLALGGTRSISGTDRLGQGLSNTFADLYFEERACLTSGLATEQRREAEPP